MLSAFLKFCLPLSVAGTGVATALGVSSSSNTEKNNAASSNLVTVSVQKIQTEERVEVSLPKVEISSQPLETSLLTSVSPDLEPKTSLETTDNTLTGQEDRRQELETESHSQSLESEKLQATGELEVPLTLKEESEGNCEIIDSVENTIELLSRDLSDYYTVSCKNQGNDIFVDQWKGLFLKSLFTEKETLNTTKKLDLNVTISGMDIEGEGDSDMSDQIPEDDENLYGITLSSSKFVNNELTGRWNYGEAGEESGAIVNITSFLEGEKIYLLF